jgi:hypothetical protein
MTEESQTNKKDDPVGFVGRLLLALLTFHVSRKYFGWIVGGIAAFFAFTRGGEVIDFIRDQFKKV